MVAFVAAGARSHTGQNLGLFSYRHFPLSVVSITQLWVYQETTYLDFHWSYTIDLHVGRNHGRLECGGHALHTSPSLP